jgi:hypothetical protein
LVITHGLGFPLKNGGLLFGGMKNLTRQKNPNLVYDFFFGTRV